MRFFVGKTALLLLAAGPLPATLPAVGSPAPEIVLDRLLPEQPVANAGLRALAGKAVVLEFWGIWCAGCTNNIAHLNQLGAASEPIFARLRNWGLRR